MPQLCPAHGISSSRDAPGTAQQPSPGCAPQAGDLLLTHPAVLLLLGFQHPPNPSRVSNPAPGTHAHPQGRSRALAGHLRGEEGKVGRGKSMSPLHPVRTAWEEMGMG